MANVVDVNCVNIQSQTQENCDWNVSDSWPCVLTKQPIPIHNSLFCLSLHSLTFDPIVNTERDTLSFRYTASDWIHEGTV